MTFLRLGTEAHEAGANVLDVDRGAVATGCCGGAPRVDGSACCVADEKARAAGKDGCGCGARPREAAPAE